MSGPRIPGFVGPPEQPDDLTPEVRSCVLRACRKQLAALQDELRRLEDLPARYGVGPTQAVAEELACLAVGVSWLWRQMVRPP